jgi:ring-1,2-phenylacetyl-CoA epoxidase subunit PaaD
VKCKFCNEHIPDQTGNMNKSDIVSVLSGVMDPEIPVLSITDLGILRSVEIDDDKIKILITPTYSGCPAMETIREDIIAALNKIGNYQVDVKQILAPAWTSDWMSESGKQKLVAFGIAAPAEFHHCHPDGDDSPEACPHCGSKKLEMISRFGSTACKALYRCLDCQEPFDYFKCH